MDELKQRGQEISIDKLMEKRQGVFIGVLKAGSLHGVVGEGRCGKEFHK